MSLILTIIVFKSLKRNINKQVLSLALIDKIFNTINSNTQYVHVILSYYIELWSVIQTYGKRVGGNLTRMIISHISRVRYVRNLYQSCLSHDRHICSVETLNHGWTFARTEAKMSCCYQYFGLILLDKWAKVPLHLPYLAICRSLRCLRTVAAAIAKTSLQSLLS
jgi:hypothetical protein